MAAIAAAGSAAAVATAATIVMAIAFFVLPGSLLPQEAGTLLLGAGVALGPGCFLLGLVLCRRLQRHVRKGKTTGAVLLLGILGGCLAGFVNALAALLIVALPNGYLGAMLSDAPFAALVAFIGASSGASRRRLRLGNPARKIIRPCTPQTSYLTNNMNMFIIMKEAPWEL